MRQGLRVAQFNVTSNPDDRPRRDHEQDQNQDAAGRRNRRARPQHRATATAASEIRPVGTRHTPAGGVAAPSPIAVRPAERPAFAEISTKTP